MEEPKMTYVADFLVRHFGTSDEFKFNLDVKQVHTKDLKKLLEPMIGVPADDQILAFEGMILKDEEPLIDAAIHISDHRLLVSSKSHKPTTTTTDDVPPDWNAEKSPLYKSMLLFMEHHYTRVNLSKLCYHMSQYIREKCDEVSFDHLEILAEKNLEEYDTTLRDRRKNYYDHFERCAYIDTRRKVADARLSESEKIRHADFRAKKEALMKARDEAARIARQEAIRAGQPQEVIFFRSPKSF